ncbi:MAG TPA: CopG family transcriptional regulator, partial [Candidatus Poseidoniales archaeon]
MSKIISLSVDDDFARDLTGLMEAAGYKNRSRFMRDA